MPRAYEELGLLFHEKNLVTGSLFSLYALMAITSDCLSTAKMSSSRRTSDIISMLVNIYGSKELFVNEYRTLLADRILTYFHYDTDHEIRYLELLKLRFGESQLHQCEVRAVLFQYNVLWWQVRNW